MHATVSASDGYPSPFRSASALTFRHLDQGPEGRVEKSSFHDTPLMAEVRSLRSALRAPVETTEGKHMRSPYKRGRIAIGTVRARSPDLTG